MYELFEHTADLGLRVRAADLDTLFAEAGLALMSAIVEDVDAISALVQTTISIQGVDREYLLFDWLNTLLQRFDSEQMLAGRFHVHVTDAGLEAVVWGEPVDMQRHVLSHEVKAITYHELKVVREGDGWLAEVIVDI